MMSMKIQEGQGGNMKKRKRLWILILVLLFCIALLFSPIGAPIWSYAVMRPYSAFCYRDSLMKKDSIRFRIPGGASTKKPDWYPFVMTFNDSEGLSRYLGEQVEFTILYNFGYFPLSRGTSSYYDPGSDYYSSFYGGYIIKPGDKNRRFGFLPDGKIDAGEIVKVPEYDQRALVLSSIGCPWEESVFREEISSVQYSVQYAGYGDWVRIDSGIRTNSPVHEYRGFQQGYLQYGRTPGRLSHSGDFPVIDLAGRVYVRYFEEYHATIVLYIMAPSLETVNECGREILSKTTIGK